MKRTIIELNEIVEVSTVSSGDVYQIAVLIDGEMNHDEVFSNLDIKELFEVMFMLREKYPPRKK